MGIDELNNKISVIKTELNNYLLDSHEYKKQITNCRGKLIRLLKTKYSVYKEQLSNTKDANEKESLKMLADEVREEINLQLKLHKEQLKYRSSSINYGIESNRNSSKNIIRQIPKELGLKFQKLAINIRKLASSKNMNDAVSSVFNVGSNVISIGASLVKAPLVGVIKLGSKIAPTVGKIFIQPLQVPTYLFSKLLNPDSKYNGQPITNMGKFLGEAASKVFDTIEQGARTM